MPGGLPFSPGMVGDRLSGAALGRSAASAGGAVAGFVVAVPLGAYLAFVLFVRVGVPFVNAILDGALTRDMPGVQAFIVGALLVVAAVVVAVCLVFALVAPIFVLVPLLGTATALRLSRAGVITRTLWLTFALVTALAAAVLTVLWALDARPQWWMWPGLVCIGAFLGRLIVELSDPGSADQPADLSTVGKRWKRLGLAWLVLLVVGVAGGVALAVGTLNVVHP